MSEDRSNRALARIEQALARIEAAARFPGPASHAGELSELQARHAQLVGTVQETLGQLDLLIESTQG